jgi:hypothetical protein
MPLPSVAHMQAWLSQGAPALICYSTAAPSRETGHTVSSLVIVCPSGWESLIEVPDHRQPTFLAKVMQREAGVGPAPSPKGSWADSDRQKACCAQGIAGSRLSSTPRLASRKFRGVGEAVEGALSNHLPKCSGGTMPCAGGNAWDALCLSRVHH